MHIRIAISIAFLLVVGCDGSPTSPDVGNIYASALSELAPGIGHFTIEAKKVQLGTGSTAPSIEQINKYGVFRFAASSSLFSEGDFPGLDVTLLSEEDIDEITSDDCEMYWRNFRAKHPDSTGLIRISEVGFDESSTEAIFYLEGVSGCTVGRGVLVFMRREAKRWVVANSQELWVS